MLNKLGGGKLVQPGDRVALVFRPDEAAQFVCAFYGCIFAAVIPVAIEPPLTREVSACPSHKCTASDLYPNDYGIRLCVQL